MSDEPTYIDWLTTIEPEEVCEIADTRSRRAILRKSGCALRSSPVCAHFKRGYLHQHQ